MRFTYPNLLVRGKNELAARIVLHVGIKDVEMDSNLLAPRAIEPHIGWKLVKLISIVVIVKLNN